MPGVDLMSALIPPVGAIVEVANCYAFSFAVVVRPPPRHATDNGRTIVGIVPLQTIGPGEAIPLDEHIRYWAIERLKPVGRMEEVSFAALLLRTASW